MNDELDRRLAANESIFREVNEAINRGGWPGDEDSPVGFRCECARLGCNALVSLTPREYERVRAHPRRFLMLPGHELEEVETIVQDAAGYVVVEKRAEAGRQAAASDPRA
jgi:hypothetical protein